MACPISPRRVRGTVAAGLSCLLCLLCLLAPAASWAQDSAPAAASPAAQRRPVEYFARVPHLSRVALSPDGKQIAALLNREDRTVLITRPVAGGSPRGVLETDNQKFHFNWIRWVSNERLLVSFRYAARRDFVGTVETRLVSVKAEGGGLVNLVQNRPQPGSLSGNVRSQQIQDQVIDWLPGDGRHVLLQLNEPGRPLPGVYKVNVETGASHMVKAPERDVHWWFTDAQHRVRVGIRLLDDGGGWEVLGSDPDGRNWRKLWAFDKLEESVWPLGFGRDPQELYVRADHEGRMAVFSVRLDAPGLPRTLRLAHPHRDTDGSLIRAPATGEVIGLRIDETESDGGEARSEWWADDWRAQMLAIDRALPGRSNRLLGMSDDEQGYLVYSSGNRQPGGFYAGDRATGQLAFLGSTHPDLANAALAGKRAVSIKARDGLTLNAYLTLPSGQSPAGDAKQPLPFVLLPHGGPHSRDDVDFDPWTEFLADRGYAVLQVNFRGSSGYGHEFRLAGLKRWGLEMQDDLTDAVAWAVEQGVADPKRVCIVGASYGGYAALMGAVKTPDLYRCAVSFAGVSDLPDLIEFESDYLGGRQAAERTIGRLWADRAQLRATSPARQAERIRAPVLLVHGTVDRRVPVDQSETMASALRRAGKPHRYIELEGGDHHLSRHSHRVSFFRALESFLDEHLKPAAAGTAATIAAQ